PGGGSSPSVMRIPTPAPVPNGQAATPSAPHAVVNNLGATKTVGNGPDIVGSIAGQGGRAAVAGNSDGKEGVKDGARTVGGTTVTTTMVPVRKKTGASAGGTSALDAVFAWGGF